MVWMMSYRPVPDRYPLLEVVEGNSGKLELEDMSDDGGVGLKMSRSFPDGAPSRRAYRRLSVGIVSASFSTTRAPIPAIVSATVFVR